VRPWALSAPILVLLISLPLLRPLRVPDPRMVSDGEQARLATIQAIVESHSLAIEGTSFRDTRRKIVSPADIGQPVAIHHYSDQSPMLSALLSGPYWIMHRVGLTFDNDPNWTIFWLTLLGVTLPVAGSAGLVYRMGRLFELKRPLRAGLAAAVVLGSGLISYSTVLNAHAPAAALLLAAAACLFHVIVHNEPRKAAGYFALAGVCAALAATIDLPAVVFLLMFVAVIAAFRWPIATRAAGMGLYVMGALAPLILYAALVIPITGDLRPGFLHRELAVKAEGNAETGQSSRATPASSSLALSSSVSSPTASLADSDDDTPPSAWRTALARAVRIFGSFFGEHGIFSHFPVLVLGILGVSMIMHRHWPATTKMLAGGTLAGALAVIIIYSLARPSVGDSMFATRWFVVFLPLTLFWAGAWLRRPHRQSSWIMAGVLLAFSVAASLIGATNPLPRGGFDRYTVAGALHNLVHPQLAVPTPSPLADNGGNSTQEP